MKAFKKEHSPKYSENKLLKNTRILPSSLFVRLDLEKEIILHVGPWALQISRAREVFLDSI